MQYDVLGIGAQEEFFNLRLLYDADDEFVCIIFLGELDNVFARIKTPDQEVLFAGDPILFYRFYGLLQADFGIFEVFNTFPMAAE